METQNTPAKWDVHWSAVSSRYNRHHAEIWSHIKRDGLWLDIGVGPAAFWEHYPRPFVGVDFSFVAIQKALAASPRGIYVHCDGRSTPFPNGQFDNVLISGVLDYFDDWEPFFKEARRVSKGEIFFTLLHDFNGHDWSSEREVSGKIGQLPSLFQSVGNWRICAL